MRDKEWLKEEVKSLFDKAYDSGKMEYYESEESIHRINSLVDQLDEPEKPVIPQFVADWIESLPENVKLHTIFNVKNHSYEEAQYWVWRNSETFARAWLYGYEVGKEKVYHVVNKKNISCYENTTV